MNNKIFDKNSTYTVIDITKAVVAATDRYQDFDSARGTVNQMINKLGIKSVNGQKRNRYFTGLEAQRVFDSIPHTKQIPLIPETDKTTPSFEKMICLETVGGIIFVRPEDISMFSLPPWYFFFTFRGWGSVVTLRTGRRIHVKEELHEVRRLITEATEG